MATQFQRISTLAGSQLWRQALTKGFRTTSVSNAAQAMTMPAMSPTMTEGGISAWKVKEGEAFTVGDVLLEIETDKAQMDVEAQDDGIMAKIIVPTGAKGVLVGTRIAVLAEEGDDLNTLEMPAEEKVKEEIIPQQPKREQRTAGNKPPAVETSARFISGISRTHPQTNRPQHPSPSVMNLLKSNNISLENSNGIVGTGPKGRLLKGDILAYVGKIGKSIPGDLEARISKLTKLDLSNIKIAPPREPAPTEKNAAAPVSPTPKESEIKLQISFAEVAKVQDRMQKTLGVRVPLSTFISKATIAANAGLPPANLPASADELFNDILGLPNTPRKTINGTFSPTISPLPERGVSAVEVGRADVDIFDVLVGNTHIGIVSKKKSGGPREGIIAGGDNLLSLKVPAAEEKRAQVFLERVKGFLEKTPGELIL